MKNKRSMIDKARQVERSLRFLRNMGPKIAVSLTGESREEAESNSKIDFEMTSIFLYALIVELTIKGLWSYENRGAEPDHTHDIEYIFSKLKHDTQTQIETIHEISCQHCARVVSEGKRQLGEESCQVEMASLVEALQWNKNAMVHLKYDLTPSGKTIPVGPMWDGITIWVVPEDDKQNFGLQLIQWAQGELSRRQGA